ncbi:MAG: hypothetical protein JXA13_02875 [Anaerolineales bacterium]|nr:hypothetical protein [Anaerolineales bacterium]
MKQDRFLIGILAGIGLLVILSLVVFFTRHNNQTYQADDTPEGVVHNYVLALIRDDYEKAYTYLADKEGKPSLDGFIADLYTPSDIGVDIGRTRINGDIATVEITIVNNSGDPLSGRWTYEDQATLVRQANGWKLTSMHYDFWGYHWYQDASK